MLFTSLLPAGFY